MLAPRGSHRGGTGNVALSFRPRTRSGDGDGVGGSAAGTGSVRRERAPRRRPPQPAGGCGLHGDQRSDVQRRRGVRPLRKRQPEATPGRSDRRKGQHAIGGLRPRMPDPRHLRRGRADSQRSHPVRRQRRQQHDQLVPRDRSRTEARRPAALGRHAARERHDGRPPGLRRSTTTAARSPASASTRAGS